MDYLDPQKKKAHKRRITFGYLLFAVVILFATTLLVYIANGYDIDRDTGEVIQNGLIFVESRPTNADIYLNGEKQSGNTDARLVVPSGEYDIGIFRPGYRNWTRQLTLDGGSLRRITYPRLIPEELVSTTALTLRSDPVFASKSLDSRWMLMTHADSPFNITSIDLEQAVLTSDSIVVPPTITDLPLTGTLEIEEWASNNRQFLATYTVDNTVEYLLIDRQTPETSINLTRLFAKPGAVIELDDRRTDRFFVFDPAAKSLFDATSTSISVVPLLQDIIQYKNFGADWTLYVIANKTNPELVNVRLRNGTNDTLIKSLPANDTYMLEIAKLGNEPVIGVAAASEERAFVYNDPEQYLQDNPNVSVPVADAVLRVVNMADLSISSDSSVIIAYGSDSFASYEYEADRTYRTKIGDITIDPAQELKWMDGQHYIFASKGMQYVSDFDGSNRFDLVTSTPQFGSYFNSDVTQMYTITPSVPASQGVAPSPTILQLTSLRIPTDQ